MSSALTDENGPPTDCCDLHTSFCKAQSLLKSLHLRPHHVHTTLGLIICTDFSSHFKHWVYKNRCNCPTLSSSCPPRSHPVCRPWFLCTQMSARSIYSFYLFGPVANVSSEQGWRVSVWLNEPEPFDWRGKSSALILFCSLQALARSSVSMGVLHTHSECWKSQQEVLENPSLGPFSVFRLQIRQQCVTVLAKPSWVTLACASLVQDKP